MTLRGGSDGRFQDRVATYENRRIVVLDLLRALAVFLVLMRHLDWLPIRTLEPGPIRQVLFWLQHGGWVGVDIFFVLSGFLVSGLLFREYQVHQSLRIGRFLVRRGLKIYPAFYLLILLTIGLDLAPYDVRKVLGEVFFLQSYYYLFGSIWTHTWTLAIEEHFYILLALLFWLLVRGSRGHRPGSREPESREPESQEPESQEPESQEPDSQELEHQEDLGTLAPFRLVPVLTLSVAVACLIARTNLWLTQPFDLATHFFPTHLRIDSLLFGVCLSFWFHSNPGAAISFVEARWGRLLALGLGCLLIPFVVPLDSLVLVSVGLTLVYLGAGMLLCALMVAWKRPGRVARAIAWWGGFSYSVYLWHLPIAYWMYNHLFETSHGFAPDTWTLISIAIYVLGSAVIGVVLSRLVEIPVLRLRDVLFPSRSLAASSKAGSAG